MGPGVVGEEVHLVGGPAAFGADGEGADASVGALPEGGGEGALLLGFAEEDAGFGGFGFEGELELGGVGDLGNGGAAGLLGGFVGDAAPAFYAFGGGEGEMFFGASGEDGGDPGDAEFGGFFDAPLEVIELEDGEQQVEREGGVGLELFVEEEVDAGG